MSGKRILVIEDEKPIAEILKYGFEKEGFIVACAYTGGSGLELAGEFQPDMVLLDWMLPDLSGVDVCRMLTERYNIPIIMLTARSNVEDKLYGLESGADDYITKPFDLREVVARVRTILRRFERASGSVAGAGAGACTYGVPEKMEGLYVVEQERMVYRNGEEVELTPKEYDLLLYSSGENLGLRLHGRHPDGGHSYPAAAQKGGAGKGVGNGIWSGVQICSVRREKEALESGCRWQPACWPFF